MRTPQASSAPGNAPPCGSSLRLAADSWKRWFMPSDATNSIVQPVASGEPPPMRGGTDAAFIHSRLDDLALTPTEFRVYCHAHRRANGAGGIYFESIPNCAKHCRINVKTARKIMARLQERGLLMLVTEPRGDTKTYRITYLEEWTPLPNEYRGIQAGRVSKRQGTPTKRIPPTRVSEWEATPTTGIPPKVIPLRFSLEGTPMKGEATPRCATPQAGPVRREVWKVLTDRERLEKAIGEERAKAKPDAQVLLALKAELKTINAELRARHPQDQPKDGTLVTSARPRASTKELKSFEPSPELAESFRKGARAAVAAATSK